MKINYLKKITKILLLLFICVTAFYGKDQEKISLQLHWKHQFQFAGYYMAKEKGFYKESGFEVLIKEYDHNINVVNDVVNNTSQFGVGRSSLILEKSNGNNVVLTAAIFQSSPNVLIGLKPKINSIKDIKNKKVMFTGDAKTDATIISMLSSNNIKLDDLITIKHSFNVDDLINGKADLMSSYISNEPYLLKKKGYEPIILDPKNYGFDFYNDILFTSDSYLNSNYDNVKNFTLASLKGWKYAFNNIEETVDVILKKYNTQNKSRESLLYEANELKKLAYYNTEDLGLIEKVKLEKIFDFYKLLGFTSSKVDINNLIYTFKENQLSFREKRYLANKKQINLCIDPNWMPFEEFDENGKYSGMSSDYFKLFSKMLNINFNLIPTKTWNETLINAKQKNCDLLSLVMETPERKEYLNFTTPYLNIPLVVTARKEQLFINSIYDLKGKKIGIPKGYAYLEIFKNKYPFLDIVEVENINDGLEKTINQDIFAYIGTLASVAYQFQNNYSGELKIISKLDESWNLAIGVRNDDPILLNIMQKATQNLTPQDHRDIANRWISIKYEEGINYTIVIYLVSFIVFIVLLFLYKQSLMKKFNEELEQKIDEKTKELSKAQDIAKIGFWRFDVISKTLFLGDKTKDILDVDFDSINQEALNKYMKNFNTKLFNFDFYSLENKVSLIKIKTPKNNLKYIEKIIEVKHNDFNEIIEYSGTFQDVTEQENIKEELNKSNELLMQKAKLAQIGEMIDAIAHQWKQPLNIISIKNSELAYVNQLRPEIINSQYIIEITDEIDNQVILLNETTDQFRKFFREDLQKEKIKLVDLINSVINLNKVLLTTNNIDIIVSDKDNVEYELIATEFKHVFINLINNTNDAFNENKILKRDIFIDIQKNIDHILIIYTDNAGGIAINLIDSIFESNITSKINGTGIGLYMTTQIIEKLNGKISVENYSKNNNKGAIFKIMLPL